MTTFLKKYYLLISSFVVSVIIFYPSLFVFFTNDDFFFLKIARIDNLLGFLNFFSFTRGPDGFGVYRPLTTQVFYLLENQFLMHVIVFLTFFGILYLIYKLGLILFKSEKLSLISVFLYSVSATHFGHFYYLATYQELGMTLFVLLMIIFNLHKRYLFSLVCFILALMSKETAVVAPFLIILVNIYLERKVAYKRCLSYFCVLGIYLFFHFFIYGVAHGDSYIWDFGVRKMLNSFMWYLIWSLNLPETLIDFIGPGIKVNPNLFIYWSNIIYPILGLFTAQLIFIICLMVPKLKSLENKKNSLFVMAWFVISLLPVIFLPIHKFSFYLTLPLIAIVYRIAYLIQQNKVKTIFITPFLIIWMSLSILTIKHSVNTSWITNGEKISKRVFNYFESNHLQGTVVHFVDTPKDTDLPWSPTGVLKNALSDKNFFYVYYPELADKIFYSSGTGAQINSRQFLGY